MQTWLGVVENRKDPLKVGRVQVRIIGAHTPNKKLIPTAELPWSYCLASANDLKEGDYVFGTYLDASDGQQPLVFGAIAGIPTQLLAAQDGFADPRSSNELQSA